MFEAALAGVPGRDRRNGDPVDWERVDMMKNPLDELLDFVRLGRYDAVEVGSLLRSVEHIYAGGTGTAARLDHDLPGMGGHEVRDFVCVVTGAKFGTRIPAARANTFIRILSR